MRQATEGNFIRHFFLVRGSLGPGLKNKDEIDDYIVYVPKYFEEAEKTEPKVKKFVADYKAFYKRDFPYDQAPLCSSSCYDHVFMLVEAMKKAGTVDDVAKIRKALLSLTYDGVWKISYDEQRRGDLQLRRRPLKKGGADRGRRSVEPAAERGRAP